MTANETDNQKFHSEIESLKKLWRENGGGNLRHLDDIPNFTGEDEPIPFPYGDKPGKDFGRWINQPEQNSQKSRAVTGD